MKTNAQAMVLASFAADALALGAHWIYDVSQIDAKFGRMTDFQKPTPPTYHPMKERGEQTHYGDQALVLLRSVAACGGFEEEHFGRSWREFFRTYNGDFEGATKQTLKNMEAGLTGVQALLDYPFPKEYFWVHQFHLFPNNPASEPLIIWRIHMAADSGQKISKTGIPYASDTPPPGAEQIYSAILARRGGKLMNLDRMLLNSPEFAQGWNTMFGAIRGKLDLSLKLRKLVYVTIGAMNKADYEWQAHTPIFLTAGGTQEQLNAIKKDVPDAIKNTKLFEELEGMLISQGWTADSMLVADGPTGIARGYRLDDQICWASAGWQPDASANCPQDQVVSACPVRPEQQIYSVALNCGVIQVKNIYIVCLAFSTLPISAAQVTWIMPTV